MSNNPKVDPKTGTYDPKEFAAYMHEHSDQGRLEKFFKEYIGDFSTGLECPCGNKACLVRDKADPYYAPLRYSSPPLIGELRPARMPNGVTHTYYGSECATLFFTPIFETKRGYVPREKMKKKKEETE